MLNPILQRMNNTNGIVNLQSFLQNAKRNPEGMLMQMIQNNPQFVKFVNDNKGKSVETIAKENGIDIELINQLLR